MPQESKLALIEAAPVAPLSAPPQVVKPDPKKSRAAIKRCCAAWQRAFDAYMEGREGDGFNEIFAKHEAGPVYCKAMPPLSDYDGIRDFIACTTYAMLKRILDKGECQQLFGAAKVVKLGLAPSGHQIDPTRTSDLIARRAEIAKIQVRTPTPPTKKHPSPGCYRGPSSPVTYL